MVVSLCTAVSPFPLTVPGVPGLAATQVARVAPSPCCVDPTSGAACRWCVAQVGMAAATCVWGQGQQGHCSPWAEGAGGCGRCHCPVCSHGTVCCGQESCLGSDPEPLRLRGSCLGRGCFWMGEVELPKFIPCQGGSGTSCSLLSSPLIVGDDEGDAGVSLVCPWLLGLSVAGDWNWMVFKVI